MSDETFLRLSRRFFSNPLWEEPRAYSRAEAWLDCLRTAAWEKHRRVIGGAMVQVERGAIVASVRYLATRWQWSKTKVTTFLDMLENEGMIEISKGQQNTTIYLCKFDQYNPQKGQSEDTKRTPKGQQTIEKKDSKKTANASVDSETDQEKKDSERTPPDSNTIEKKDKGIEVIEEGDNTVERIRAPKKETSGEHAEFIRRWKEGYPQHHGDEEYLFQGAKDGAQVSRLLKSCGKSPEELQRVFVAAWKRPDLFNCKAAASIAGFVGRYNEIIAELNSLKRAPELLTPAAFRAPMNPPPKPPPHIQQ